MTSCLRAESSSGHGLRQNIGSPISACHVSMNSADYIDTSIGGSYLECVKRCNGKANIFADSIGKLLETCFYMSHICILKNILKGKVEENVFTGSSSCDMYHNWLLKESGNLKHLVYKNFKLIEPLF